MVGSSLTSTSSMAAGTSSGIGISLLPLLTPKGAEAAAIAAIEKLSKGGPSSSEASISKTSSLPPPPRVSQQPLPQHVGGIPHSTSNTISPPRASSLLECDYDVNPTELYQAIEARQWDYCRSFFRKHATIVARECQTWVVRKEPNGKLRWRLLPLHAAIIFQSPLDVIEKLVGEYPMAAQCKDDQGMLPLHLAFRNETSWSVLEELMTAHPNGIFVKDRKGRTPLQCCPSNASQSMSKSTSGDCTENNINSRAAGVLELYAQIAVSAERQKALAESRAVLEARVGALQESHAATLTSLRDDWEQQSKELQQEISRKTEEVVKAQLEINELKSVLGQKNTTQVELTEKLRQVTLALNVAHEKRTQLEATERAKWQQRRAVWQESHQETLVLVQSLMEQQSRLMAQLHEADVKRQSAEVEWQKGLVETVERLQQTLVEDPRAQSNEWKTTLQEQNKQANERLAAVLAKTRTLWVNDGLSMVPNHPTASTMSAASSASPIKPTAVSNATTAVSFKATSTSTPVKATSSPVKTTSAPVKTTSVPVKTTSNPVVVRTVPSTATTNPVVTTNFMGEANSSGKAALAALMLNANASGMVSAASPATDVTTSTAVTSRRQLQPKEEEKKEREADPPAEPSKTIVRTAVAKKSKKAVHSFYPPTTTDSALEP